MYAFVGNATPPGFATMNPSRMGSVFVSFDGFEVNDALAINVQANSVAGDNTNTTSVIADYATNATNATFVMVESETPVNASVSNRYSLSANGNSLQQALMSSSTPVTDNLNMTIVGMPATDN
jgi:hypothetical protein